MSKLVKDNCASVSSIDGDIDMLKDKTTTTLMQTNNDNKNNKESAETTPLQQLNENFKNLKLNNDAAKENQEISEEIKETVPEISDNTNDDAANEINGQAETKMKINDKQDNETVYHRTVTQAVLVLDKKNILRHAEIIKTDGKFTKVKFVNCGKEEWIREDDDRFREYDQNLIDTKLAEEKLDESFDEDSQLVYRSPQQPASHRATTASLQQQRISRNTHFQQNGGLANMIGSYNQPTFVPQNTQSLISQPTSLLPTQTPLPTIPQNVQPQLVFPQRNTVQQSTTRAMLSRFGAGPDPNEDNNNNNDGNRPNPNRFDIFNRANRRNLGDGNGGNRNNRGNDDQNGRNNNNNNNNNGNDGNVMNIVARNQENIIQLLRNKNKDSYTKLPKCDVKYYGKKKNGEKDDLLRKVWEVREWCKTKGIPYDKMFNIWKSDVLQGPAKSLIYTQTHNINNFEDLIEMLSTHYPVEPKIFDKLKELREFKYTKKTSMAAHVNKYSIILHEIIQEKWIWENIIKRGRTPDLPTYQQQYQYLFRSIKSLERLYYKVQELMVIDRNHINSSGYFIQQQDVQLLAANMIKAEQYLYPNNELVRFDKTYSSRGSYGGGRRKDKSGRNKDTTGRNANRYPNQAAKRDRRNRQDKKRQQYQNDKKFTGKCYACGGSHQVRICPDKAKKTKYCRDNNLCLFCVKPGHQLKDCKHQKEWKKKRDAGNGNNTKPKKWNRQAIRYATQCNNGDDCKFKHNCFYLHAGDQEITDDETDTDQSEPSSEDFDSDRTERLNYNNKISTRKERMFVKTTLEIVNMHDYQLSPEEIPNNKKTVIHLQRNEESAIKYKALLDTGSTISAIIPTVAEELKKKTNSKFVKESAFMVENGGGKDVKFTGEHLVIPTLKPNTKEFIDIKYYVMPHNECCYGIILGDADMEEIGYVTGLRVEPGKVLFSHNGKRRKQKMKNIESGNDIMDRLNDLPGYALRDNVELYEKVDELKDDTTESNSSDETDSEDVNDDDDEEDGSRPHL